MANISGLQFRAHLDSVYTRAWILCTHHSKLFLEEEVYQIEPWSISCQIVIRIVIRVNLWQTFVILWPIPSHG